MERLLLASVNPVLLKVGMYCEENPYMCTERIQGLLNRKESNLYEKLFNPLKIEFRLSDI
jgi:hypothetical protein